MNKSKRVAIHKHRVKRKKLKEERLKPNRNLDYVKVADS
jgi:hypothetical protein